jgi:CheY-like chemotaxis protein
LKQSRTSGVASQVGLELEDSTAGRQDSTDGRILSRFCNLIEHTSDPRRLILIVEDNADHLAFLRVAVGARYRVATATNGLEAYELACRIRPDVILLDLVLPVLDGYALVEKLRANPATSVTPVVFVTGLDRDRLVALPPRSTVLRKPCHQGEILQAIQNVMPTPPIGR